MSCLPVRKQIPDSNLVREVPGLTIVSKLIEESDVWPSARDWHIVSLALYLIGRSRSTTISNPLPLLMLDVIGPEK
jgi:hypothetical protein